MPAKTGSPGAGELFLRSLFMGEMPKAFTQPIGQTLRERGRQAMDLGRMFVGEMPEPLPQDAGMLDRAIHALSYPGVMPTGPLGKVVYHGTPHKFPPTPKNPLGEFDLSKIGTGEGAQAYGHGLYFAESPGVAREYDKPTLQIWPDVNRGKGFIVQKPFDPTNKQKRFKTLAAAERHVNRRGRVLKADLPDEAIPKMLDWDAPLSQQPEAWKAIEAAGVRGLGGPVYDDMTGQLLYQRLTERFGREEAGKRLGALGIPGIKYLDQGSRAGGKGTRNFVVWEKRALPTIQGVE